MPIFDPYTKAYLCSILSEQKEVKVKDPQEYAGWDVVPQTTWWNYKPFIEKQLEGITSGMLSSGIQKTTDAIANALAGTRPGIAAGVKAAGAVTAKGVDAFGGAAEFAAKQGIRTLLGQMYLGKYAGPEDVERYIDTNPNSPEAKSINSLGPEVRTFILDYVKKYSPAGLASSAYGAMGNKAGVPNLMGYKRFSDPGLILADELPRIAFVQGLDPLDYAMQRMGAKKSAEAFERTATVPAESLESIGGFLQKGKQIGIYK